MSKSKTRIQTLVLLTFIFHLATAVVCAQNRALAADVRATGVANASVPTPTPVAANTVATDREQDGLTGPVRRVRTETTKITQSGGKQSESPRALLEVAAYDVKGSKVDNAYYPSAGNTLTGKEVYQYDDKGNITEMTLYGADGSALSKEIYTYEFDSVGNWTKMVSALAVVEGGKISYEPSEVTYRTITYYLGGATARLVHPAAGQPASAAATTATTASSAAVLNSSKPPGNSPAADGKASARGNKAKALPNVSPATNKAQMVGVPGESFAGDIGKASGGDVIELEAEPPSRLMRRASIRPVSGGVLNGTATSLPKPIYSDVAKRARVAGMVTVEVTVDEKGKVISARATSGPSLLHAPAVAAAYQAKFSPTLLSGQAVRVAGVINYNFVLNNNQ